MADHSSVVQSPTDKFKKPNSSSSFFTSPRLFTGFSSKGLTDSEFVMSPTSILDSKPFSAFKNTFWSETLAPPKSPKPENRSPLNNLDSVGVGLGIANSLVDEISDSSRPSKPESRKVLFGSQLKIQIPTLSTSAFSGSESPKSPADFGIKTRNSQLGSFSPCKKSPFGSSNSGVVENGNPNSPRVFSGCLSASEMELSEDYTCVISYGPNPKTTHIFDDCIVESCCGVVGFSGSKKESGRLDNRAMSYPSESFLSFCYSCKKNLGLGKDIYMYRGEKAFCSSECRFKEMMLDEGIEKLESKDAYGAFP